MKHCHSRFVILSFALILCTSSQCFAQNGSSKVPHWLYLVARGTNSEVPERFLNEICTAVRFYGSFGYDGIAVVRLSQVTVTDNERPERQSLAMTYEIAQAQYMDRNRPPCIGKNVPIIRDAEWATVMIFEDVKTQPEEVIGVRSFEIIRNELQERKTTNERNKTTLHGATPPVENLASKAMSDPVSVPVVVEPPVTPRSSRNRYGAESATARRLGRWIFGTKSVASRPPRLATPLGGSCGKQEDLPCVRLGTSAQVEGELPTIRSSIAIRPLADLWSGPSTRWRVGFEISGTTKTARELITLELGLH